MKLLNRGGLRALALLTQVGINMIVPIAGAVWIARIVADGNALATIGIIVFGTLVAFRNFYVFAMKEARRRDGDVAPRKGRPTSEEERDE